MATFSTSFVLKCFEWRCQGIKRRFRKPKHTKKHINKDSNRYFVEQILKILDLAKFMLYTFNTVQFSVSIDKPGNTSQKSTTANVIRHPWY